MELDQLTECSLEGSFEIGCVKKKKTNILFEEYQKQVHDGSDYNPCRLFDKVRYTAPYEIKFLSFSKVIKHLNISSIMNEAAYLADFVYPLKGVVQKSNAKRQMLYNIVVQDSSYCFRWYKRSRSYLLPDSEEEKKLVKLIIDQYPELNTTEIDNELMQNMRDLVKSLENKYNKFGLIFQIHFETREVIEYNEDHYNERIYMLDCFYIVISA